MSDSIAPGESRYTELTAIWQAEGSPYQFEERGTFGCRAWTIHYGPGDNEPTFLLKAAATWTSTGYDPDTGKYRHPDWPGPRQGSEFAFRDTGLQFLRLPERNNFRIKARTRPRDTDV